MKIIQKRSRVSVCADRISNLPESIICHILSFLSARTVVATSVLSMRWKFLWTAVTTLNFLFPGDLVSEDEEEAEVRKFVWSVNKVITHVEAQVLQKFRLQWWQGCWLDPEYVPLWTSYAVTRSVGELVINLVVYDNPLSIQLPGTLFTCASLIVLKIHAHFVFNVPRVVHLPKLEVLDLHYLTYESSECIPRLLTACPVLHSLEIGRNKQDTMLDYRVSSPSLRRFKVFATDDGLDIPYDGKLRVDAPNLEYFALDEVIIECSVKRLALVNSVNLDLDVLFDADSDDDIVNGLYVGRCNSIVKLVEAMESVKFFTLKGSITKALSYATIPLSVCFRRLAKLDIRAQCCHWSSVGTVLGKSTELRILNITKTSCGKSTHVSSWNDPVQVPRCLSSSLQQVSFANFRGMEDEIAMIKYILLHGKVLESFTLKSGSDPKLLQHISTFPRFSPLFQIQFD